MIVFQLHSSIYYREAKNNVIKFNIFNPLIDHGCFDASSTPINVFDTCLRNV